MSKLLCSASGTSTAGQDLVPVMRTFTSLPQGVDDRGVNQDSFYPFRPTISYFEADIETTVSINGETAVPLKSDGLGGYILTLEQGMVHIRTVEITDVCNWKSTFLY